MSYLINRNHLTVASAILWMAAPLLSELAFAGSAAAQISGLCNTGETPASSSGCTGVLVTPNPEGGGPSRDGNWQLAYPYPSTLSQTHGPCHLHSFAQAWVDTPNRTWMPNTASGESEWLTPHDGENNLPMGWYVYRTSFPVPSTLPDGSVPTGLTINGRLTSDNATYGFYLESPARSTTCGVVSGPPVPINPAGQGSSDYDQWWDFSFTSPIALTAGADAYLYVVVYNPYNNPPNGESPTGMRIEFFPTSAFN
ncbi:MAG: hypothetical protein ACLP59_18390 [Bryobacteraceae bacterium]